MSRRIDIELTSALGDGTWTWRAAGAKQPRGVLDGTILPDGAAIGDELKVEVDQEIDGITVLSVVHGREKQRRDDLIELLPPEREFQPVIETRARRGKGDRRPRRDDDRRGRRDGDGGRDRRGDGRRDGRGDGRRGRDGGGRRDQRRRGPSFTPPPEVPQRPKPKRLRPGKQHRNEVLAELPEEQRPIAELALQGLGAVRQRLREDNEKAAAEGRATMPEASVMKLAEELLPKLRVAEWRDRAEAAQRQMQHLDLRDLRSVVAAAGDPIVARDESTRALSDELKDALVHKQEQELQLWFGDVDAALAVGRVIRALRLSSQPPKAGVPFPVDIAKRLIDSTNASLAPMDSPDRWIAMLEAAAFSPIHASVAPATKPDVVNDELTATVKRLAPALPHVAALFEIEVDPKAPMPKPLRPTHHRRGKDGKDGKDGAAKQGGRKQGGRKQGGGQRGGDKGSGDRRGAGQPQDAGRDRPRRSAPEATDAGVAEVATEPAPDDQATDTRGDAATATTDEQPATEPAAATPEPAADSAPTEPGADTDTTTESSRPAP
ncbi:MAG: hypothetical protein QNJ12_08005, partial [Ilumatobacter sp.]|nr:hypothetical protein [Ilumatobacter sp.]